MEKNKPFSKADAQFFAKIYDKYYKEILSFLARKTGDKVLAEDLTHDTFESFMRKKVSDYHDEVGGYLITIASNKYKDHLRGRKFRNHLLLEEQLDGHRYSDRDLIEAINTRVDMERFFATLSEKKKEYLMMKAIGYRYDEIASRSGETKDAVRNQVSRAKKDLRKKFNNYTFHRSGLKKLA